MKPTRALFIVLFALTILMGTTLATVSPAAAEEDCYYYAYLPIVYGSGIVPQGGQAGSCLSPKEAELARLINEYRASNGLPAVPFSRSLTTVAQYHVRDLQTYHPDTGTCNLHSWSPNGDWNPVCYTSDYKYASGMWDKPKEITKGVYTSAGFEIAAKWWGTEYSAQQILNMWKNSAGHRDVILEKGMWAGKKWPAMGVGISENYGVVWFSTQTDPVGTVTTCP